MKKIMFVCHGNICRSPMAEFVFKKMIDEKGLSSKYEASSSATSSEEIWNGVGNPVYHPAKAELKKHGIECNDKRAIQLTKSDYDKYDMFIAMDSNNVRNMHRTFGNDKNGKISKLMDYTNRPGDVADPWYTGRFEVTYRDIYEGCLALLNKIITEGESK